MTEPEWILPEVAIAVHQMVLAEHGGLSGLRDDGLLESTLIRPRQRFAYEADVSIFELAASYAYGIARNHPFVDGNKRMALSLAAVFLEINRYSLRAPEPEAAMIFTRLASGEVTEDQLTAWIRNSYTERA